AEIGRLSLQRPVHDTSLDGELGCFDLVVRFPPEAFRRDFFSDGGQQFLGAASDFFVAVLRKAQESWVGVLTQLQQLGGGSFALLEFRAGEPRDGIIQSTDRLGGEADAKLDLRTSVTGTVNLP